MKDRIIVQREVAGLSEIAFLVSLHFGEKKKCTFYFHVLLRAPDDVQLVKCQRRGPLVTRMGRKEVTVRPQHLKR